MSTDAAPLLLTSVLGLAVDEIWHDWLHALEHHGRLEWITIPEAEAARRRMRVTTDRGRGCAIALPRTQILTDGAVLYVADDLAIVVRVDGGRRLRLTPHSLGDAMRLGHWCGNLHWKVVFAGGWMEIVLDGPEERYRERLRDLKDLARFDIGLPEEV